MRIAELFDRDITRAINGVVKADQRDDASVWQELEEFVLTKELDKYFGALVDVMVEALDQPDNPNMASKNGIWISGFFGSGKSHLIKVFSYLLNNTPITKEGESRYPISFFEEKIDDALQLANVKRLVDASSDVVLFNIDSKADRGKGDQALIDVFLRVFNEMQGFSPDHPYIADMEQTLASKGQFDAFKAEFESLVGEPWVEIRDGYDFHLDEVIAAYTKATGQSEESARKLFDRFDQNYVITPELFAKKVKKYIDSKGGNHRIIFVADEVGQFIGDNRPLMLNLQTIAEDLGTHCGARAFLVVTSQEAIDEVVKGISGAGANDFSKIQGRFVTKLSLSSKNSDEVIQRRLLDKRKEAEPVLAELFRAKGDIINNQLTFTDVGMTLKTFEDEETFSEIYPFAPYQFVLVQKIFETIRRTGFTGKHLSRGERSMLDAFQNAAKQVKDEHEGVLIPLYRFYPAIESFLDTGVRRTIEQAGERKGLNDLHVHLLQTLFMIRRIDEITGTVDNLVTLFIDQVDTDKMALRTNIEEALQLLEQETLVGRSGDQFHFLTNEEQEISREIQSEKLNPGAQSQRLATLIYEDLFRSYNKHDIGGGKLNTSITRYIDDRVWGQRREDAQLTVRLYTPFYDEFGQIHQLNGGMDKSLNDNGCAVIALPESDELRREVTTWLKTDEYCRGKSDAGLPDTTQQILREQQSANTERNKRIRQMLIKQLRSASAAWVSGKKFDEVDRTHEFNILTSALDRLADNVFTKMSLLPKHHSEVEKEIDYVLKPDYVPPPNAFGDAGADFSAAVQEVRTYVGNKAMRSEAIILHDLLGNFEARPYGWPPMESLLLVARMIAAGELSVKHQGVVVDRGDMSKLMRQRANWRKIELQQRQVVDSAKLQKARKLGTEIFGEEGPDLEDALHAFLREHFFTWHDQLSQFKAKAETPDYPALKTIESLLSDIAPFVSNKESARFIEALLDAKDDLLDAADDFRDLHGFYTKQQDTWRKLIEACKRFHINSVYLDADATAAAALKKLNNIREAEAPWNMLKDADDLIAKVEGVHDQLIDMERAKSLEVIESRIEEVQNALQQAKLDDKDFWHRCHRELATMQKTVQTTQAVAQIKQEAIASDQALDKAMNLIAVELEKRKAEATKKGTEAPLPAFKVSETLKSGSVASEAVGKNYLENPADIEKFLAELKKRCDAIIAENKRIKIS